MGFWNGDPRHNSVSWFMAPWGIPFVLAGQYFIWGRFFVDAWLKRRTYYAVTNRRAIVLQEGWKRKIQFTFLDSIQEITCDGSAVGTLWLGPKLPAFGGRGANLRSMSRFDASSKVPSLSDIDDVDLPPDPRSAPASP